MQYALLTILGKKPLESIVGKGENSGNQHFLLFPQSLLNVGKNARGKNVIGENVRGKIARGKIVRAKVVKIP